MPVRRVGPPKSPTPAARARPDPEVTEPYRPRLNKQNGLARFAELYHREKEQMIQTAAMTIVTFAT